MSIDPLAEDYTYNSPYAFAENKVGMGRELEGCELGPFVAFGSSSTITSSPFLGTSDAIKLTTEVGTKATESTSKMSENFAKGNASETEQLAANGLEKNTKPIESIDPKTGEKGTTIPDSMKPDGGTVEIKNVSKQSLTQQLRLQKNISESNGVKPELIINQGAKLSKPLQNSGFDIKTYELNLKAIDNTSVPKPLFPKTAPTQKKEEKIDTNAVMI